MDAILTWLVGAILNWLKKQIESDAAAALAQHNEDVQRGITNTDNLAKYNAAKTRAEKIQAATDLLNRNTT